MWTPEDVLATVPPARATPGRSFDYESINYLLLGLVVERQDGTNLAAALRRHVLADPRLTRIAVQPWERPQPPLAFPLIGDDARPRIQAASGGVLPTMASVTTGGAAVCAVSDSRSLAVWGYLLFGGHVVSAASLDAMTSFGPDPYGMAVWNQTALSPAFGTAVGNAGWDPGGYTSALTVLPSRGVVITVLTNEGDKNPVDLVFPVVEALSQSLPR